MKRFPVLLALAFLATPAFAQRGWEVLVDAEGVHRAAGLSSSFQFEPGTTVYEPHFDNGGGAGAGFNFWFSDRMSLETKVAGIISHLRVRQTGSDFIANADLGNAQVYPITAIVQWHPMEHGTLRPYLGVGAAHIILRNIERRGFGVTFDDPTGLVVDGGLRLRLSSRWSAYGDVRYVTIETKSTASFTNGGSVELDVRPLIAAFGIAYRF
jgi:outer membrane protein W